MEIVSLGPLPSALLQWQSRPGSWTLSIAAKATFHLHPGEAKLAPEQQPILEADRYWDESAPRSLHTPSDIVPFKPFIDIILVGSAYAPAQTPTRSLIVGLSSGDMVKAIEVHCDRAMNADDSIQEGTGFTRMPLVYERTTGGAGTWNPVGMRADARDQYNRIILPNLQPVGIRPTMQTPLEPIGFGPIAPQWPMRIDKLRRGTTLPTTQSYRENPLPPGLDAKFFNAAPPDQQLTVLPENPSFFLENLHPEFPQLRCHLPAMRPAFFVQAPDRTPQRLAAHIDTVVFDTDLLLFTVTWRVQFPLNRHEEWSRAITTLETGTQSLTFADIEPLVPALAPASPTPASKPRQSVSKTLVEQSEHTAIRSNLDWNSAPAENPVARSTALPFRPAAPRAKLDTVSAEEIPKPRVDTALPFAPKKPIPAPAPSNAPVAAPLPPAAVPLPAPSPAPAPIESSPWASSTPTAAPSAPAAPAAIAAPIAAPIAASMATSMATSMAAPMATPMAAPNPAPAPVPAPVTNNPHADVAIVANALNPTFKGTIGSMTASNAAAASTWTAPAPTAKPSSTPSTFLPRMSARLEAPEVNQLLWFDDESVTRFRRNAEWKPILKELERKPRDKELDDPALAENPMDMEDRREVFEILTHGSPKVYEALQQLHFEAIREDGKFVPPLALVSGELTFPFDELETLKATVTTVSPLVTPSDENLRAAIENAKDFLKTPGLSSAPAVSEGLTTRIKDAFNQGRRSVPSGYVDIQVERALLEQRHYQRRTVFGARFLRALLPMSGSQAPMPAYIPDAVAARLPMYQRFRARLIVEVCQQEDQYETHALAIRVLALSRITPSPKR